MTFNYPYVFPLENFSGSLKRTKVKLEEDGQGMSGVGGWK